MSTKIPTRFQRTWEGRNGVPSQSARSGVGNKGTGGNPNGIVSYVICFVMVLDALVFEIGPLRNTFSLIAIGTNKSRVLQTSWQKLRRMSEYQ